VSVPGDVATRRPTSTCRSVDPSHSATTCVGPPLRSI
jgi:hypothetical protein